MEIWKHLNFNANYEISSLGNLRNSNTLKLLKFYKMHRGYYTKQIKINGKSKNFYIARLVAEYFVPNSDPNKKIQVDHINRIKTDNRAENLRWVTPQENVKNSGPVIGRREKIIKLLETIIRLIKNNANTNEIYELCLKQKLFY